MSIQLHSKCCLSWLAIVFRMIWHFLCFLLNTDIITTCTSLGYCFKTLVSFSLCIFSQIVMRCREAMSKRFTPWKQLLRTSNSSKFHQFTVKFLLHFKGVSGNSEPWYYFTLLEILGEFHSSLLLGFCQVNEIDHFCWKCYLYSWKSCYAGRWAQFHG